MSGGGGGVGGGGGGGGGTNKSWCRVINLPGVDR